jgi:hypothetical protein
MSPSISKAASAITSFVGFVGDLLGDALRFPPSDLWFAKIQNGSEIFVIRWCRPCCTCECTKLQQSSTEFNKHVLNVSTGIT